VLLVRALRLAGSPGCCNGQECCRVRQDVSCHVHYNRMEIRLPVSRGHAANAGITGQASAAGVRPARTSSGICEAFTGSTPCRNGRRNPPERLFTAVMPPVSWTRGSPRGHPGRPDSDRHCTLTHPPDLSGPWFSLRG